MENENEKLISIEEVIERAREKGVDFGKGDPKNRLRYYTKIGLIPHAKRKSFNGAPPTGAYPENVIERLVEIDREIKEGKSVQQIKKEMEKRKWKEKASPEKSRVISEIPIDQSFFKKLEEGGIEENVQEEEKVERKISRVQSREYLLRIFLVSLLIWVSGFMIADSFLNNQLTGKITSLFSARANLLAVKNTNENKGEGVIAEKTEEKENENLISSPQYLTLNAQTTINGSLEVSDGITTPEISFPKGNFLGSISPANLSANRNYLLPDASGTICLSSGNCVGIGGEVLSAGGEVSRLAKFTERNRIGNSSILDLFNNGVSLTIDNKGNVGIGENNPSAKLDVAGSVFVKDKLGIGVKNPENSLEVKGKIHATGDICTDLNGGKCLSEIYSFPPIAFAGGGISGSGLANVIPIWTNSTTLGNSILSQNGNELDVAGTVKMTGFQLTTGAQAGYVLVSDENGVGTWQQVPGSLPSGTDGQTLRYDGSQSQWIADSFLYNSGSQIGIGTSTSLPAVLTVAGDGTIPEFTLKYDDNNYVNFLINDTESKIEASKAIIINSLTGEVKMGSNVTTFDASGATVKGATFISADGDATVRKSEELILREIIPIFRSPIPLQTTSDSYVRISKYIEDLTSIVVSQISGTERKYSFLINFADDIEQAQTSDWRVYQPGTSNEYATFTFSGQNMSSLEEGKPHLTTPPMDLPDTDWQLEVKVPTGKKIRVFNILLLVFDKVQ